MYRSFAVFCVLVALCVGCGTKESTAPQPAVSEPVTPPALLSEAPLHPAVQTVSGFMTAMLRGEDEKIRVLLTPAARKAGEEKGMPFSPPASDTATFVIDETAVSDDSTASVFTTFTDVNPVSGQKESAEIVWTVARTDEGWRVSRAFVSIYSDQPKVLVDFEDPETTKKALMEAEAKEKQKHGNKHDQ